MASSNVALSLNSIWGKILTILGYSVEIFLLTGLITYIITGLIAAAITVLVLIALCSLLIVSGYKIKQRIKRFKKYSVLILLDNTTSLDLIALKTSQSVDFVRTDIKKMIDKGFFDKAYIDNNTNEVIISREPMSAIPISHQPVYREMTTISCDSCGATNEIVKGELAKCEYCGTSLK